MDPVIEPVILANSKFSFDLLKVLCKDPKKNVLFSPLSISSALGLVVLGAPYNSTTAEQMYKALHYGKMRIMYHYLYEELYKEGEYKNEEKKRSLQLVNRLYGEKTVNFKDDFLDVQCEEWCFAGFRSVDFKTNPQAVRKQINSWVEKKTSGQIKDLLEEKHVSKDTSLALISAVYFKKKWVKGFTSIGHKTVNGVNWPMMSKLDKLPLGTIPHRQRNRPTEAHILEIPYENNHLSMLVILPEKGYGLQELVDSITYENILEWTEPDNMIIPGKKEYIEVQMPIFTLQEKYGLEEALKALGITELFSDQCDLSGMAENKELKLSKAVHKSVVEVNEVGTTAQAADGEVVQNRQSDEIIHRFIADHPFLFFIRHNPTKSIIFWGRVISP